jgi:hypothetical protein
MADTTGMGNGTGINNVAVGQRISAATFNSMLDVLSAMVNHTHNYTDVWASNCNCNCTCQCSRGQL